MTSLMQKLPSSLTPPQKRKLLALLREKQNRERCRQFEQLFPEAGDYRRELYPKHLEFFRAGSIHRERLFMAGSRVGKTVAGGYETTCHLTGLYPDWWEGRRFMYPVKVLAAGDTGQSTKDIIQEKMLGGEWGTDDWGTGMIPRHLMSKPKPKQGISGGYEEVKVKHVTGGWSVFKMRSYDQGRRIFQGFELDVFWPDEEVPQDVYAEGLIRTMTTQGMVIMTFTPLNGLTPLVLDFMTSMNDQELLE
ncbi:terminase large subunit domain-containing protein [Aliamphritea hakodatensis]|uniref:terminase large subunit domain-containing protein n=1 Tax=Aliamphritea hakodatensis TaxID=2895352 RepID=UPI0022FD668A|nr:terminase family protein [Aliamphritea hakodatensis]